MKTQEAIKKIEEKIREDLQEKLMEYESRKTQKIKEIMDNMESRWEKRKKELEHQMSVEVSLIKGKIISDAKMKAKMEILRAREEVLNEVKRSVYERLQNISQDRYTKFLLSVLKEAASSIGMNLVVKCLPKDEDIVKQVTLAILPNSKIETTDEIKYGGIIITTQDGRTVLRRTFEDLLEARWPELRKIASKVLFEEV